MPVQAVKADAIRAELDALGERRRALKKGERELRDDTRDVLRRARGVIPVAEASRRAALNRSTVYELYLAGDGDEERNSREGSGQDQ